MHQLWVAAALAALAAAYTGWQQRHIWTTSHASSAKAALAFSAGLALVGPLGEPWGRQMHVLLHMHNLEDFHGHFLMLGAAHAISHRALKTLGWNNARLKHMTIAALIGILIVGAATRTILAPSDGGNPADTGYWVWTSFILAPAFGLAALSHAVIAREYPRYRQSAIVHSIPFIIGFTGAILRPLPLVPDIFTYWCYLVCAVGLVLAAQASWRRVWVKPIRELQAL